MKTIGLLGGMSWESTQTYYQLLNRMARERLGGLHSAQLLLWSFDFAEVEACQAAGDWDKAGNLMIQAARRVELGGADCLLICTNTMHKLADEVQAAIDIPLIHIADTTAAAIKQASVSKPLLLATRYTMEQDFYKGRLKDRHGIDVIVPHEDDRATLHRIIYEELCQGIISPVSRESCLEVVGRGLEHGVDSLIFGCTEIGLLISPDHFHIPCFDTTELHARAAMEFALG